jgi:hypothetical protein
MNSEREAQREYYILREMVAELETDVESLLAVIIQRERRIRKTMQDVKTPHRELGLQFKRKRNAMA